MKKSNISHWMAGSCRCFLRAVQSSTAACARRHPSFSSKSCPRQRPAQGGSRFVSVLAESVNRGVQLATPPGAPHLASWHHTSIWKRCQRSRSSNMVRLVERISNIIFFLMKNNRPAFLVLFFPCSASFDSTSTLAPSHGRRGWVGLLGCLHSRKSNVSSTDSQLAPNSTTRPP